MRLVGNKELMYTCKPLCRYGNVKYLCHLQDGGECVTADLTSAGCALVGKHDPIYLLIGGTNNIVLHTDIAVTTCIGACEWLGTNS